MRRIPTTTLFMLMSLDGKISTGASDAFDFDKDLPTIHGVKEGLRQYYEIEKTTDIVSLNSGRVMKKIGVNSQHNPIKNLQHVRFVLVDNKPHLTKRGILNLANNLKAVYIITTDPHHPANAVVKENVFILFYPNKINFENLFQKLHTDCAVDRMTIQSGGQLNTILVREGLVQEISVVIAPCLIGGSSTPTLMDGKSISSHKDLKYIKTLKLHTVERLKNSYIHLKYHVMNK